MIIILTRTYLKFLSLLSLQRLEKYVAKNQIDDVDELSVTAKK